MVVRLRLTDGVLVDDPSGVGTDFERVFAARQQEADEFYATIIPGTLSEDASNVMRQALGGMLWSKQFYHYVVRDWLNGDPGQPAPPESRRHGRNWQWSHLYNADVISMPDKWEYPWYAAWDLAFHCVPLGARRLRVRQGSTDPAAARVVHASQRAAACVRVGARAT